MGRITFTIRKDGSVDIDVACVQGASCEQITRAFEDALGGEEVEKELRPEYYSEIELAEQHVSEEETE